MSGSLHCCFHPLQLQIHNHASCARFTLCVCCARLARQTPSLPPPSPSCHMSSFLLCACVHNAEPL